MDEDIRRFNAKVDRQGDDDCWLWRGSLNTGGYGSFFFQGRNMVATHFALMTTGRPRPSPKHGACHTCDTPACVNPAHLWWGTAHDNMQDASRKGRIFSDHGTHCRRGHPFARVNKDGEQICRTCEAERQRRSRARKAEAANG